MAMLSSLPSPISSAIANSIDSQSLMCCPNSSSIAPRSSAFAFTRRKRLRPLFASHICAPTIDKSLLVFAETASEHQLWAAACLRVRSFYEFDPSAYAIQVSRFFFFFLVISSSDSLLGL